MRCRFSAAVFLAAALFLVPALPAAAEVTQSNVVLVREGDAVEEDLYAAADVIEVRGRIEGDLVAAAFTEVRISGEVTGSVTAIAGTVNVSGKVGGSLRVIATRLEISGQVGGDVLSAAWATRADGPSSIGRDLLMWGRSAVVSGQVGRDLKATLRSAQLSGAVGRNVDLTTNRLTVTDTATVRGDLGYRSDREAVVASGATIDGSVLHRQSLPPNIRVRAIRLMATMLTVLGAAAVGLIVIWAFPERSERAARVVRERPWVAFAWGLGIVATPAGLFVLAGLAIALSPPAAGIPLLAVFTPLLLGSVSLLLLSLLMAPVPTATAIGVLLIPRRSTFACFVLGMSIVGALILVPWVALVVVTLVASFGLGGWLLSGDA